ncbi:hypothetical protein RAAC3_TM7C00001G0152 [Candidatus Saccharibacteria bacterium RAAC3_TM7_1]|nr:hypothetical protein RAAC3_TM7C00001G0152 [Candidatus Saccharibacteria bacterium RAAC3_TM7_1]
MVTKDSKHSGGQGLATASLTLGIISIPLLGVGAILGILAIIFGAVSLRQNQGRKKSVAGIITGSIGILIAILLLVVYLAVPSLQANNNDTARKADVTNLTSDVIDYQANNRGKMPSKYELSKAKLVQVSDIKQAAYDGYGYDGNPKPTLDTAVYTIGENCNGEKANRNFSITVLLENNTVYCVGS